MAGQGNLQVRKSRGVTHALKKLVMAWARDSVTGQPRYILEVDADHRGAKCGCECPSCREPLTAINAAKSEYIVRPHFRHPDGIDRHECLVLAARTAAMRQLMEDGWIDLPLRRRTATATGLTGTSYEAWVEQPATRRQVSHAAFEDPTRAVLTLDDGRVLQVLLTGSPGIDFGAAGPDGLLLPTIYLDIDTPELADLNPDELRARLQLLPDSMQWCSHWQDNELDAQALAQASEKAVQYLDAVPQGVALPDGLDPTQRRETLLHLEVKRILEEQRKLKVPKLEATVAVPTSSGRHLADSWSAPAQELVLDQVWLEHRFGRMIPDVICHARSTDGTTAYEPLLIEVTVTNIIDDERHERIRQAGQAALEIDFSRTGGRLTREELVTVVVDGLETKSWLFNPTLESHRATMLASLEARSAVIAEQNARRERVLATPIAEIAQEYLDAVLDLNDVRVMTDNDGRLLPHAVPLERAAEERVADAADKLALHGYPEAADERLVGHSSILARILSCKHNRPVGYKLANVAGVLNAVRQLKRSRRRFHSLVMIAVNVYEPELKQSQRDWYEVWRNEVVAGIRAGESDFIRSPIFDRLLSILFPEMAHALAKPWGKQSKELLWDDGGHVFRRPSDTKLMPASFLERQPLVQKHDAPLVDTAPTDWWLKGRDLEAWKRANPSHAAAFMPPPDDGDK